MISISWLWGYYRVSVTKLEIESRTLRAVERLHSGQKQEDSFLEFKREFTSKHNGNARRLAGLANAARGEPVLWIVGVDEKAGQVVGAGEEELSDWWAGVAAQFDEFHPSMQNVSVPVGSVTVQALAFETDRAPFVVKTGTEGAVTREVPWREGTRVDSARRSDLIKLLVPLVQLPNFEILDADFRTTLRDNVTYFANAKATIYVLPIDRERVVFPFHKLRLGYESNSVLHQIPKVWTTVPRSNVLTARGVTALSSKTITESSSAIIVDGPGKFEIWGNGNIPVGPFTHQPLSLSIQLTPAASTKTAALSVELELDNDSPPWTLWKVKSA